MGTKEKRIEQKLESTHDELVKASRRAGMAEVAACVLHNVGNVLNSINIAVFQADKATKGLMIRGVEKSAALISENAAVERFLVNDERGKMLPEYLNQLAASMRQDQQEISADLNSAISYLEHVKAIVSTQQKYATGGRILEEVDLSEVLEDAIGMSSRSLARHEISLVRDFEAGITVSTDKHRLLQTLVNLIRNAKQALKAVQRPDKQLTLKIEQIQSGTISILIQDNGIGIEKGNLLKLFNHGFTDRKDGNGFGLHSGANFAQELGGSLVASSEGIGCGATFTLTIPIDPTAASGVVEGVFGLPSSVHGGLSTDSSSAEV